MANSTAKRLTSVGVCLLMLSSFAPFSVSADYIVEINVSTAHDKRRISPYIFGINEAVDAEGLTAYAIKQGGDRFSTYNFENNFSNAGASYFNTSDNSLVAGMTEEKGQLPAAAVESLLAKSKEYNIPFTITTLPMMGYVAADGNGPILSDQLAPSERWLSLRDRKDGPLSLTPDLTDGFVYSDEYINLLLNKNGKSTYGGIKAYALDNAPTMWQGTHKVAHPEPITCDELMTKSISLAKVVKGLDDRAMVFGGEFSNFLAFANLNGASDWATLGEGYSWFIDYYLATMKESASAYGKRLIDALDIRYYSEEAGKDGETVVSCKDYSHTECNAARMQAPRTLWDSSYTENSWVGEHFKQYTPLLPMLQASINRYYSGTKLAISEYDFGGGGDISGAIAQVDALGSFANEGVYLACLNASGAYQKSAINLYTNYDKNGSSFGNTTVRAETSDDEKSSAFAALSNADDSVLRIILTNKSANEKQTANITVASESAYGGGEVYGIGQKSSDIVKLKSVTNVKNNVFSYELAPLSVVILVLTSDGKAPEYTAHSEIVDAVTPVPLPIVTTTPPQSVETTTSVSSAVVISSAEMSTMDIAKDPFEEVAPGVPLSIKVVVALLIGLTALGLIYLFASDIIYKK